jgi:ABC-type glycerol-3-phosphate transport system substrate-binding protein
MKRTLLLALVLAVLSGPLAACSGGLFGSRKPVTLRFAYRAGSMQVEALLAEFHDQYPHITVEPVVAQSEGGGLRQLVSEGRADLFRDGREALAYAQAGWIQPIGEAQLAEWSAIRSDYYAGAWSALAGGGQQWGIPAGLDPLVVYANAQELRALGMGIPAVDQRWDAFGLLSLAVALDHPEGTPEHPGAPLYGFCTQPEDWDPFVLIYRWGGALVDRLDDPQRATLTQRETVEAVRWYTDLFTVHGVAPDPTAINREFPQGGMAQAKSLGRCGVWLGLYSERGGQGTPSRWAMEWAMLPLPRMGGDVTLADVQGYYLAAGSEHPEEALLLARFLSDRWSAAGRYLPPRQSLAADPAYGQAAQAGADVQSIVPRSALVSLPAELSPRLGAVGEAVIRVIYMGIQQGGDVEQLLHRAQEQVQRFF